MYVPPAVNRLKPMAIQKGNTAPIAVTSMLDSKVVTAMNKQQLEAEQQYYIAMSAAKSMFQNGIISAEVLAIIDTKLLEKWKPISATLLSDIPLTL